MNAKCLYICGAHDFTCGTDVGIGGGIFENLLVHSSVLVHASMLFALKCLHYLYAYIMLIVLVGSLFVLIAWSSDQSYLLVKNPVNSMTVAGDLTIPIIPVYWMLSQSADLSI